MVTKKDIIKNECSGDTLIVSFKCLYLAAMPDNTFVKGDGSKTDIMVGDLIPETLAPNGTTWAHVFVGWESQQDNIGYCKWGKLRN